MKSKIMLRLLPDDRYLAEASKEEPVWIGYYPSTPHYIPLDSTDATPAGFYDMVKLKYELTLTSSRYQNNKEDEQETVNMRDMVGKDDKTGHGQGTNEMWTTVVKRGKRDSADMKRRAAGEEKERIQTQEDKLEAGLNLLATNTATASLDLLTVEVKKAGGNAKGSLGEVAAVNETGAGAAPDNVGTNIDTGLSSVATDINTAVDETETGLTSVADTLLSNTAPDAGSEKDNGRRIEKFETEGNSKIPGLCDKLGLSDNTEKTLSEFTETTLENAGKIDNMVGSVRPKDDKTGHGQGTNEMWTTVVKRGKRDSADMKRRATDNTEKTLSEFTETTLENAGKIDNLVALHSAIYLSRQPKKPNETNVVEKKKKAKFTSHKYFMRNEEAKQWTKFLKEQDEGAEQHFKDERSKKVDEKANMEQEEEQEKKRKRKHEKRKANMEPKEKNAENGEDIKTEVEEVKWALIWRRRAIRKRKAMRKRSRKRRRQAAAKRRSWFRKQARQIKQRGRRGEEEKKQHCETEKEQSDREGEEQSEEKREQEKTEASRCEANVARKPRDVSTAQTTLAGGFGVDPDNLSAIDQVS